MHSPSLVYAFPFTPLLAWSKARLLMGMTVFCEPPPNAICLTCSTHLTLGTYGSKPAVVPRKKKKKRKLNGAGGLETGSARGTPAPGE